MAKRTIDYDSPFILDVIFREQSQIPGEKPLVYKQEVAIMWDDILNLRTYPFVDEYWGDHQKDDKFLLTVRQEGTFLCLGNFKDMFKYWQKFLKDYYGKNSDL